MTPISPIVTIGLCILATAAHALPTTSNTTAEFCRHEGDGAASKCYEACAGATFASKGFTGSGKCGIHFNTVDKVQ